MFNELNIDKQVLVNVCGIMHNRYLFAYKVYLVDQKKLQTLQNKERNKRKFPVIGRRQKQVDACSSLRFVKSHLLLTNNNSNAVNFTFRSTPTSDFSSPRKHAFLSALQT